MRKRAWFPILFLAVFTMSLSAAFKKEDVKVHKLDNGLKKMLVGALAGMSGSLAAQEKIALRFAPAEGTRLTYTLTSVVNVDGKNFLGKDLALNADSRGEIQLFAKPSTHETVRADLTSPGIEVNVRLFDRVLAQKLGTTEGEALEVVFNRTGKVEIGRAHV